jgi:hypothetical protein
VWRIIRARPRLFVSVFFNVALLALTVNISARLSRFVPVRRAKIARNLSWRRLVLPVWRSYFCRFRTTFAGFIPSIWPFISSPEI